MKVRSNGCPVRVGVVCPLVLLLAIDGDFFVGNRLMNGCERVARSCLNALEALNVADLNEKNCDLGEPNSDAPVTLADVIAELGRLSDNPDLDGWDIEGWCGIQNCITVVTPPEVADPADPLASGTFALAAPVIAAIPEIGTIRPPDTFIPRLPSIRPVFRVTRIAGAVGAYILLASYASQQEEGRLANQAQAQVDKIADRLRVLDIQLNRFEDTDNGYDNRARNCVYADLPWREIASLSVGKVGGVQNPEQINDYGFRAITTEPSGQTQNNLDPASSFARTNITSHLCLEMKIYLPGELSNNERPLSQTTQHQREALGTYPPAWNKNTTNPTLLRQKLDFVGTPGSAVIQRPWAGQPDVAGSQANYYPQPTLTFTTRAAGRNIPFSDTRELRKWSECERPESNGTACDEFPFSSTGQHRELVLSNIVGLSGYPSLKLVDFVRGGRNEAVAQGRDLIWFNDGCPVAVGESYLVIPQPISQFAHTLSDRICP